VCSNKITDESVASFKKLTALKKLSLFGTNVSDKGLKPLADLKQLETLDLRATPTTTACAAALKTLPRLKVLYPSLVFFDPKAKMQPGQYRRLFPRAKIMSFWEDEVSGGNPFLVP